MKCRILIFYLSCLLLLTACFHSKDNTAAGQGAGGYVCPMTCEGDKVYPVEGTCPVCGMDLIPVKPVDHQKRYVMHFTSIPDTPVAGQPTQWSFIPGLLEDSSTVISLEETHEKLLHIIIVSEDLSWYDHVHPDLQANGSYATAVTLPFGSRYLIFADFKPKGEEGLVERLTISATGAPNKKQSFVSEVLSTQTDGYLVAMDLQGEKWQTGIPNQIGVTITEKGKPVTNLENLMGVKGHLVIISTDGLHYVHVHAEETIDGIRFQSTFEQPGFYRAFFQFQTNGKIHTSYFTLNIEQGKHGSQDTMKEEQEHDQHHGMEAEKHTH